MTKHSTSSDGKARAEQVHLMAPVVLALQCRTGREKWRLLGWTSRAGDLTGMPELLERRRMRPYIRSDCTGEPPAARFQCPWLLRRGSIPGTGIQIAEHAQKVVPGLLMTTAQAAGFKPLVKALANHFSAGHRQALVKHTNLLAKLQAVAGSVQWCQCDRASTSSHRRDPG
jgi:hypothetical protein